MREPIYPRVLASTTVHASILLGLLITASHAPRIAPTRLPGTEHGLQMLTYYSAGGTPAPANSPIERVHTAPRRAASTRSAPAAPALPVAAPAAEAGTGTSGPSGLGQGNINIALQKHFPSPRPDLSTLAAGSSGDVVVDATIDAQGNITQLTLVHGLTDPIDNAVLAAVRQWTYTPATRDGIPIPSEQELLFHYQRG